MPRHEEEIIVDLRWNGTLYMDQKVCLVKKDQLCAIALMNRK